MPEAKTQMDNEPKTYTVTHNQSNRQVTITENEALVLFQAVRSISSIWSILEASDSPAKLALENLLAKGQYLLGGK